MEINDMKQEKWVTTTKSLRFAPHCLPAEGGGGQLSLSLELVHLKICYLTILMRVTLLIRKINSRINFSL